MKTSPKLLRRLKKLTLVHLVVALYIIFSFSYISYELFIFEENIPNSKPSTQTDLIYNGSITSLNSNFVKEPILEEITPIFDELQEDMSSTTIEQETTSFEEETTTQKIESVTTETEEITTNIKEEETTQEQSTEKKEETTKLKFTNFDYSEPVIENDLSLDEYIYSLIEEYSSYETRVELNYDNIYLLARLSIAESEDQCFKGNIAVCEVAVNRSVNRNQTLKQVIFAKNSTTGVAQFSCTVSKNPNKKPRIDLTPRKIDVLAAVRAILGDMPTDGSNYFVDPKLAPNSWAERNRKKSIKIEDHQFFY